MANRVLDFFKKAYPFIATGLSLAGPAGNMAAGLIKTGLSLTDEQAGSPADPMKVVEALGTLQLTPDQQAVLAKAEMDYQANMAQMGYKSLADLAALEVQDRDSARGRQIKLGGIFPQFLCVLLTGVFAYFLWFICVHPLPQASASIIYGSTSSLGTAWAASVYYFVGSSLGSDKKTDLLAQAPPIQKG